MVLKVTKQRKEESMKLNKLKEKTWIHGDLGVWAVFIILCAISLIEVYSAS